MYFNHIILFFSDWREKKLYEKKNEYVSKNSKKKTSIFQAQLLIHFFNMESSTFVVFLSILKSMMFFQIVWIENNFKWCTENGVAKKSEVFII